MQLGTHQIFSIEFVLKKDNTNCRVKRHLQTTWSHKHGRSAETKPDSTIPTHRPNYDKQNQSKVPNFIQKF